MDMATSERVEAFVWDERFSVGLAIVDEQHHRLVELVNELGSISARVVGEEELGHILGELASYTVYHFETEEALMREHGVSAAHQELHVHAHRHFTAQVKVAADILRREQGASSDIVGPLLKYLINWIGQHILGADTRMGMEIRALQAGDPPELAVRKAEAHMSQSANVLMAALNEMFGKLGDKTLEVMQKNQELEQRVRERTQDLELANAQLQAGNQHLRQLNERLESAHGQLLQSEKLASIGQLAAGVAHEINNPVGFVNSNVGALQRYVAGLFQVIEAYAAAEAGLGAAASAEIARVKQEVDFEYLKEDIPSLLKESQEGLDRVTRIVKDLKDFSHVDEAVWQTANVERGLDSTLNVVANELKYKADVVKQYGGLPEIVCMPSQLNQVFMNLLVNAAQAIDGRGTITVRTGVQDEQVWVEIQDTGKGIPAEVLGRIFDPFFTTKPVGKGTGLGLSLSFGIVQKHRGRIEVRSEVGVGSTFRVWLPMQQPDAAPAP